MTSKKTPPATVAIMTKGGQRAWCGINSAAHLEAKADNRVGHPKAKAAASPAAVEAAAPKPD